MKHVLITTCIALLVTSCSLFRQKTVHRSRSESEIRTTEKRQTAATIESEQLTISSAALEANHRYQVQIIPEGSFHYSPDEGFTGSARRVIVQGRVATSSFRSQAAAGRSSLAENAVIEKSREQQTESQLEEKQVEVKREGVGSWWVWLVGVGVLFAGWKVGKLMIRFLSNLFK